MLLILGLAVLLSFSRGAWVNLGVAVAIYGVLHLLTARRNRVRLKFAALTVAAMAAVAAVVVVALQFDEVADLLEERAALTQSYDEGPEGRFGGQQKAAGLILEHPLGIGAQQFVPQYHHEEPHNVYLAMFLNAGWLGGLVFLGLVGSTTVLGLRHALRARRHAAAVPGGLRLLRRQRRRGLRHRHRPLAPFLSADGAGVGPDAGETVIRSRAATIRDQGRKRIPLTWVPDMRRNRDDLSLASRATCSRRSSSASGSA